MMMSLKDLDFGDWTDTVPACLAIFVAYTAGWLVAFYRDFRVPKGDEE